MKNVGRIFSIIGGIFSILSGITVLLSGVLCICLSIPAIKDAVVEYAESIEADVSFPIMEYLNYMIAGAIVSGVILLVYAVFFFIAGGLSLGCHRKHSYIATIIFSVLTGFQILMLLGAIFGMIFDKKPMEQEPVND